MTAWQKEHSRWQAETSEYRGALLELANSAGGFSGARIRHETHEFILYGMGQPSPAVIDMMERAPANVHVSWVETPHSKEELTAEVLRILSVHRDRLHGGGPLVDGTGIRFDTDDPALLEASDPTVLLGARFPVVVDDRGPGRFA